MCQKIFIQLPFIFTCIIIIFDMTIEIGLKLALTNLDKKRSTKSMANLTHFLTIQIKAKRVRRLRMLIRQVHHGTFSHEKKINPFFSKGQNIISSTFDEPPDASSKALFIRFSNDYNFAKLIINLQFPEGIQPLKKGCTDKERQKRVCPREDI